MQMHAVGVRLAFGQRQRRGVGGVEGQRLHGLGQAQAAKLRKAQRQRGARRRHLHVGQAGTGVEVHQAGPPWCCCSGPRSRRPRARSLAAAPGSKAATVLARQRCCSIGALLPGVWLARRACCEAHGLAGHLAGRGSRGPTALGSSAAASRGTRVSGGTDMSDMNLPSRSARANHAQRSVDARKSRPCPSAEKRGQSAPVQRCICAGRKLTICGKT